MKRLTLKELRRWAKGVGMRGYSRMKRDDLSAELEKLRRPASTAAQKDSDEVLSTGRETGETSSSTSAKAESSKTEKLIVLVNKSGAELEESIRKNAELILGTESLEELMKLLETGDKDTIRISVNAVLKEFDSSLPMSAVLGLSKEETVKKSIRKLGEVRKVSAAKRAATKKKEEETMKKMTVKELREQAKVMKIRGYSRMSKQQLEDSVAQYMKDTRLTASNSYGLRMEETEHMTYEELMEALRVSLEKETASIIAGHEKELSDAVKELRKSETREELTAILERYTKKEIKNISSVLIRELQGYCPNFSIKGETKANVLKLYTGLIMEVRKSLKIDMEDYAEALPDPEKIRAAAEAIREERKVTGIYKILEKLTKREIVKVYELLNPEDATYYDYCDVTREEVIEEITEYIMEDKGIEASEEDPLRHGPFLRRADGADEYVDVEEMKLCARNIHKLHKDEWEGDLEELNSLELEVVLAELGLSVLDSETKDMKRARILMYLEMELHRKALKYNEEYFDDEEGIISEMLEKEEETEICETLASEKPGAEIESESITDGSPSEKGSGGSSVLEVLLTASSETVSEIVREMYGEDYVKTMLIELLKSREEKGESRPVTEEEFRKAFEELERGQVFVNIPELRKALNWSREEFDGMLRKLRDDEVINLHVTDLTKFEPEEFFYDDDNSRMGMLTWHKGEEERLTA